MNLRGLNNLDYKLIVKNKNFFNDILNLIIKNYRSYWNYNNMPLKMIMAYKTEYKTNDIPDNLKSIFDINPICSFLYLNNELEFGIIPEKWVFDKCFNYLDSEDFTDTNESIGYQISRVLASYIKNFDFNDVDKRFIDSVTLLPSYLNVLFVIDQYKTKIKNFDSINFKTFFLKPLEFEGFKFYLFLKRIFEDKFDSFYSNETEEVYDMLKKLGYLDIYLKHSIEIGKDEKLREYILSLGVDVNDDAFPEIYRKIENEDRLKRMEKYFGKKNIKEESFSFKSFLIENQNN